MHVHQVPDIVTRGCVRISGGDKGWVYDPFKETLLQEYYDCAKLYGPQGDTRFVPLTVTADAGKGRGAVTAAFSFDKQWCVRWNEILLVSWNALFCMGVCMRTAEHVPWASHTHEIRPILRA